MRKKVARRGRRVSVSAESGEDADADFVPPKIPKSEAQSERIAAVVRKVFLFQGLSTTELNTIIGAMSEKTVGKGVELIKQGGVGDFFYVVDKGAFDVFVKGVNNDKPVFDYHEGGSFGELALMYNAPRAATVTATEESVVWCVDRKTFRKVVIKSRIERSEKYCSFLKKVKIFANLTDEELSQLADGLMPCDFADGEVVIKQGDDDRDVFKFYLVVEGEASVTITRGNKEVVVARVKVTDYFGEKALIEHQPRAATVTASGALQLASMDYQTFERLMGPLKKVMARREYKSFEKAVEEGAESKRK